MENIGSTILDPVTILAMSKLPNVRNSVEPGSYKGRAVVVVDYGLNVGEDFEQSVAAAMPYQRLFLSALSKLNAALGDVAFGEALASIVLDETPEEHRADLAERAKAVHAAMAKATTRTVKGKVTGTANMRLATFDEQVAAAEESLAIAAASVGA